jgi:acyl dehydratase
VAPRAALAGTVGAKMKFSDFHVGQVIEAGPHTIDELSIIEFANRFDPQPFHVDKSSADQGRWNGLIASGFHTCCIAMRLVADSILRESGSCGSPGLEYVKWPSPVRPGDALHLRVHVLEVRRSRSRNYGVVRWQWYLLNQHDQPVLDLIATSLFEEAACAVSDVKPAGGARSN